MESSIAASLMRWSACELLPTSEARASCAWELATAPFEYRFATGCMLVAKVVQNLVLTCVDCAGS